MATLREPADEPALRPAERDYRRQLEAVANNATLAFFIMDERQHCTYMNPAAERLTGYRLADLQGKPLHDAVHHTRPDGSPYPLAECPIDRAFPQNEREQGETSFVHRDGHFFPVAYTASPIRNSSRPVGTVIEVQDLTDRKRIETELREQNEVVEAINRIGQMLTSELDLERLLQAVTDVATELAGAQFGSFFYNVLDEKGERYTLYTLSGVPREAFSTFPMPRNTEIFGPTFRGEGIVRLDDVTRDPRYGKNAPYYGMPKGHLPVRSYLAVPVVSRTGEPVGGLFFGHSEPGVFTARVERLLAGIATQAGIAIDNARLYAQAREAVRLRDEFLSIASHELRNPVAGIKGAAQLLRRSQERGHLDPERLDRYLSIVEHTANRLAGLTEDLLDVSRLQRGLLPLRARRTDLYALLRSVLRRLDAHSEHHVLRSEVPDGPRLAVVDPDRVEQIVENLLQNAIKYSPEGGEIMVQVTDERGGIAIRVRDAGIGLPAESLEQIFEPFGRAANAVRRNIEGLGLGLYICRQIAEQHGGRLWAESVGDGQGTTLTLWLPEHIPDPSAPADSAPSSAPGGGRG